MRHLALALAACLPLIGSVAGAGAEDSPSSSNRSEEPNAKGLGPHRADPTRTGTAQPVAPRRSGDANDSAGEDATGPMRPGETPPAPGSGSR